MRKVLLSMEEQEKYEVIKRMDKGNIYKQIAAVKIGCTKRHIYRLLKKYCTEGKTALFHGNKGRKPLHTLSLQQKTDIVVIYNKYWDTNS